MNATKSKAPLIGSDQRLEWRGMLHAMHADGLLDAAQVASTEARFGSGDTRLHPLVRLGRAGLTRVDGKALDIELITEWLAAHVKLPYLRIDPLKVDVGRVADVMSAGYAEKHRCLPVAVGLHEITVAVCEPQDTSWVEQIESHSRKTVKRVLANPLDIARYTTEFFTLAKSVRAATKTGETSQIASFEQLVELGRSTKQLDANDQGVVQVVDWLWQYAFDQRASDIHLEPRREMGVIRFRIDGVLHTVYQLPASVMTAMVSRIKLLGRMDVVERRRPLDGRIKTRNPAGEEVEMRLSTLPTAFGEKMVMRIFDPDNATKTLDQLGFGRHEAERWSQLIGQAHGIILVTGPTGSGKTTTLYSTLKRLATDEVNLCTIEDPIEMIEPAFNQTQVQNQLDFGFAEGLRALMRQDPDIIMVGEIRDLETAEMAIQASLTGHLVFSTLHTNDAVSAITRLTDIGVPPYLIGATVIGVLAQRLVRTLCPACKQPDEDMKTETLVEMAKPWRLGMPKGAYKPVGCLDCRHTGYRGRAGLYELMQVNDPIRQLLQNQAPLAQLRRAAAQEGLRSLRLGGIRKVADGLTTLEEVLRSTPSWDTGALHEIQSQRDLVAGLLFVVTGVAFAWGATNYDFGNAANPGPGYFPFGLGVLLAVLGGLVLFSAMSVETADGDRIGSIGWRPLLVICACILIFALALPRLGLPLAVALVAFLVSFAGREARVLESLLLAAGLAVFCAAVFVYGLGLNLPLKPAPLSAWGF